MEEEEDSALAQVIEEKQGESVLVFMIETLSVVVNVESIHHHRLDKKAGFSCKNLVEKSKPKSGLEWSIKF